MRHKHRQRFVIFQTWKRNKKKWQWVTMELPQVQRNYSGWKGQGRKKGFEAWGFNLWNVVVLQQNSLTMTTTTELTTAGKLLMHPHTPWKIQMQIWKWKHWEKKKGWVMFLNSQHFEGKRACQSFRMGIRSESITRTDLHNLNNKLVNAWLEHFWCTN